MDDNKNDPNQGFSDLELADIMSEIESLEEEFESPAEASEDLSLKETPVEKTELQQAIDEEASSLSEAPIAEEPMGREVVDDEAAFAAEAIAPEQPSMEEAPVEPIAEMPGPDAEVQVAPEVEAALEPSAPEVKPEPEMKEEKPAEQSDKVVAFEPRSEVGAAPAAKSKMDFSVQGDMEIMLCFDISGQKVELHVNGEDGLRIETGDGARFLLPMKKAS